MIKLSRVKLFKFLGKNLRAVIFYLLANHAETAYLIKLPRLRAFQRRTACPIAAKKSCSSHLLAVVSGRAAQTAFGKELLQA